MSEENLLDIAKSVDLYGTSNRAKSVTFFGGSFNPFHEGHLECLNQCEEFEDNIIIVLDYSPWKKNTFSDPLNEYQKIKLKTQGRFPIYTGFWASEVRNPTCSWLKNVEYEEVNWLMGDDTFGSFLKWNKIEQVCKKLSKIYVVPREEKMQEYREVERQVKEFNSNIEVKYLRPHQYQGISSTKIRD